MRSLRADDGPFDLIIQNQGSLIQLLEFPVAAFSKCRPEHQELHRFLASLADRKFGPEYA